MWGGYEHSGWVKVCLRDSKATGCNAPASSGYSRGRHREGQLRESETSASRSVEGEQERPSHREGQLRDVGE